MKAIKWLTMVDGPLVIRPMLDPRMWIWGMRLLANCTERAYAVNKSRMVRLAEYSNERMVELRGLNGLTFDGRRYDCGDKAGYVQANLAVAIERDDIGAAVKSFARDLLG